MGCERKSESKAGQLVIGGAGKQARQYSFCTLLAVLVIGNLLFADVLETESLGTAFPHPMEQSVFCRAAGERRPGNRRDEGRVRLEVV